MLRNSSTNSAVRISRSKFELVVLYSYFILFLVAVLSGLGGNLPYYVYSSLSMLLVLLYLWSFCPRGKIKINLKLLFSTLTLIALIASSPYSTFDIYPAVFYLHIMSMILLFNNSHISSQDFINFLNRSYVLYVVLSLAQYFNILPQIREMSNIFDIHLGSMTIKTIYGLDGSTAHIDSFSCFIVIANLFLNKRKHKKHYILFALIITSWTTRLTPFVGLLFSTAAFIFIRNRFSALFAVIAVFFFWLLSIYLLLTNVQQFYLFGHLVDLDKLLYHATHARSMIWKSQLEILFRNYNFSDFVFGNFNDNFYAQLYTIDGNVIDKTSNNAHNSYLANFYRSPFLAILFYILMLGSIWKNFRRWSFPVIYYILIVAYSNATILSIYNPLFLLTLVFLLLPVSAQQVSTSGCSIGSNKEKASSW